MSQFVEVEPGVRVFVQDFGTGTPLVFIHGYPYSHRTFEKAMHGLASKGFRAVGLDLRGYGQSDKPWGGLDYDTWIADIAKVITALNLNNVTLAGFSMGGAIAAHYVAHQTDARVVKLALLAAAGPALGADPKARAQFDGFIAAANKDHAQFVHDFVSNAFHHKPAEPLHEFVDQIGTAASFPALIAGLTELRDRDLTKEFAGITLPTLICHGVHDSAVPFAAGEAQHQMITGSKLVRFEHSGHLMPYEEGDKFLAELLAFHGG